MSCENSGCKRLKILLCCYACDPTRGSEPGMGWNFAYNISLSHDVHVLVEEGEFRNTLNSFSAENPELVRNITFHFIPRTHHETLRKIWPPSYYWFYRAWHKQAYKYALQLNERENFDIIHQITISGFREPGYLWKIDKPFVWGPLGGFTDTPWCLLGSLGFHGAIYLGLRNIINFFHKRWGRRPLMAANRSYSILTSTTKAVQEIRQFWHKEAVLMNEVGLETRHTRYEPSEHTAGTPLRLCWAGEHKARKALDLLLEALPLCKEKVELHVLSKGPRMNSWKALTHKLGLDNVVTFHGYVPREEAFRIMGTSHVFCITSVREDTSTVVFEAFRYGVPIIALDHCGFAAVINENCGIKIPICGRRQVIRDYARHIDYLATHEEERRRLSAGALERCQDFTWEAKMAVLNEIYQTAYESSRQA